MSSVNKVVLIGNLGRDPEIRYLTNNDAVTNITVATTENWKDKATGEKRELTEWHRVTMYRKLAEIANEHLKKGSQVYIEGKLQTRKWTDKEGIERYSTEIIADTMQMLGSRFNAEISEANAVSDTPIRQATSDTRPSAWPASQTTPTRPVGGFFNDDDIPF